MYNWTLEKLSHLVLYSSTMKSQQGLAVVFLMFQDKLSLCYYKYSFSISPCSEQAIYASLFVSFL